MQILVIDDGSTDATAGTVLAIEDSRVRLISQKNSGKAHALQKGVAAAGSLCRVWAERLGLRAGIPIAIGERIEEYGVPVKRIVCAGGIAEKSPMLMQIYADVTGRTMQVAGSSQACALGSAISAAVLAGEFRGFSSAQKAMTPVKPGQHKPRPAARKAYDRICQLYRELHDAFGGVNRSADLSRTMKELLEIKRSAAK
ncbi:MAG: FGGY-family carbohydrate kinase [Terrimicrobiaceae bacterium]